MSYLSELQFKNEEKEELLSGRYYAYTIIREVPDLKAVITKLSRTMLKKIKLPYSICARSTGRRHST